ncbi:MAG: DNA primase, partial [Pirellulales bacterium]
MSHELWLQTKEQVRQAVDIVDLIGSYMPLKRQGHALVGLCPWHADTRPSLQVNPDRQSFKCWVCDIGGDIFTFVMRADGVEFREALEMLADRAGIELAPPPVRQGEPVPPASSSKKRLRQAIEWAAQQYHDYLLRSAEAKPAREYLAQRGISEESIRTFKIGYAPQRWDWILTRARGIELPPETLEKIGLVIPRQESDGFYDRFRGRVLFPICDAQGRTIALGGRILPDLADKQSAKYINSPETALFSKSRQLYGLDLAKDPARKEGNIIVVEGYTDCVMLHQHGVTNVVAVLGTALGPDHVQLLRRYTDSIILTLDGDAAGQRRSGEILDLFVALQVDLKILVLPESHDPCDFLGAHGSEAFRRMLADAVDALEHKIRMVTQGLDPSADTHQANMALEEVLATMAKAPRLSAVAQSAARLRESQLLARLARKFVVGEEAVRGRLTGLRRQTRPGPSQLSRSPGSAEVGEEPVDPWDRELLELVLQRPDWAVTIAESILPDQIRTPIYRTIYVKCMELVAAGIRPDFERLMLESSEPRIANFLVTLDQQGREKAGGNQQLQLEQLLGSYRRRKEDAENRNKMATLRGASEETTQVEALDQLIASLKSRHRRTDP